MKKFNLIILLCLITIYFFNFSYKSYSQSSTFQVSYDYGMMDIFSGIEEATNGYVLTGSVNGSFPIPTITIKVDSATGTVLWARKYQDGFFIPTTTLFTNDLEKTSDGGFVYTGGFGSSAMVFKTNFDGSTVNFSRKIGASPNEYGNAVIQSTDLGYVVAGSTSARSVNSDKDSTSIYVFKLNSGGTFMWGHSYSLTSPILNSDDVANDVTEVSNGYVFVGTHNQLSGVDTTSNIVIFKTDFNGNLQWMKSIGELGTYEEGYSIKTLSTGELLIIGTTDKTISGLDASDIAVIKTDASGNIISSAAYDIGYNDIPSSIQQTNDGGFSIIGWAITNLFPLTIKSFVIKLDASFNVQFAEHFNSMSGGMFTKGKQITGNGFIIGSMVGNLSYDLHLIKTSTTGLSGCNENTYSSNKKFFSPPTAVITPTLYTGGSASNFSIDNSTINPTRNQVCVICTPPTINISATDNIICIGNSTTITATGGGTYLWNNGSTNSSITVSPTISTTYYVTVSSASGCTGTNSFTVNVKDNPIVNVTSSMVSCTSSNGTATANPIGGVPGYTYLWDNSQITQTITGLAAGTYSVTVTDSNGCTSNNSVIVNNAPIPTVSVNSTQTGCTINNGTATATPSGGTPGYSYLWNNSQTSQTAINLVAGNYTVTITDSYGCTATASANVSISSNPTVTISNTNTGCTTNNGTATATPSGGTPGYTYFWSNAQTNQTATSLSAGTYTVTITDTNGCTVTDVTNIITSNGPTATTSVITNVNCFNGNNGSASSSVSGGTPAYTYLWSNSQNTNIATNLTAGIYTLTVTDAGGCSYTSSVTITEPTAISATITSTNIICFGLNNGTASVNPSGGIPNYTYLWDNGETTPNASNLTPFTHHVTITDANSCTYITSVDITEPMQLLITPTQTDVLCLNDNNGSATATTSGGTPTYLYNWSNSQTTVTISNLTAGTYTVTVTDSNGCTNSLSYNINQPTLLTSSISGFTNITCFGQNTGDATVIANGGTPNYSYLWNNSQNTQTATNLIAGTYSVIVIDNNGCSSTSLVTITEPTNVSVSYNTISNISCYGESNGSISINVSGGTPSYSYLWSNALINDTINNLTAGIYNLTITDSNNCTYNSSVTVTEPTQITATFTSSNITCFGLNNGTATANVNGGTAGYNYLWDNSSTSQTTNNLLAGIHSVTITDANSCQLVSTVNISEPQQLNLTTTQTEVLCFSENNGTSTAYVSGGSNIYTYFWNPTGQTTQTAIGLSTGNYSITVTDSNGCSTSQSININQPSLLTSTLSSVQNSLCNGESTGNATFLATGGTPNYSYLWSNGQNTSTAINLHAGIYNITISDSNNCTTTNNVTITEPAILSDTGIIAINQSTNLGYINIIVSNGSFPYSYLWSNNDTTENIYNLNSGTYIVTITDVNQCFTIDTFDIFIPILPIKIPTAITPNSDNTNDDFEILHIDQYSTITLEIFNRWGDKLFYFSGSGIEYSNKASRWNGKFKGKDLPMGGYVYILKINGLEPLNGIVSIIR